MTVTGTLASLPPAAVAAVATCVLHRRGGLPAWQALAVVLLGLAAGPAAAAGQGSLGDQLAAICAQVASWAGRVPPPAARPTANTASGTE